MQAELNRFQYHINSIPSVLHALGLRHAVICPGSRNAPLIMAFARFGGIECHSVMDERAAGFLALGISKQTGVPAAVICTSGSALANIYPAVLEAYYMQVPLLVISADRPPEMIDKWDGQTIHQYPFFFNHIKASFNLNVFRDTDMIDEYVDVCADFHKSSLTGIKGPSHLNVPMDEPLYDAVNESFEYPAYNPEQTPQKHAVISDIATIADDISRAEKVLILIGADTGRFNVNENKVSQSEKVVVLADLMSNNRHLSTLDNWEAAFLSADNTILEELKPDLLLTCGKMVLNKRIKQFLRNTKGLKQIHVEPNGYCPDTFDKQPEIISADPALLFESLIEKTDSNYKTMWLKLSEKRKEAERAFDFDRTSELGFMRWLLSFIERDTVLHLSNSFSVRNAAFLSQYLDSSLMVHCNRGVSGIDGCTSTAIGMAIADEERPHLLVTGDVAFLYDNAFLVNRLPGNLKIVVINNDGGGIFRLIDGPGKMRELEPYMTTPHGKDLWHLAGLHNLNYMLMDNNVDFEKQIRGFMGFEGMAILEFKCVQIENTTQFNKFKSL